MFFFGVGATSVGFFFFRPWARRWALLRPPPFFRSHRECKNSRRPPEESAAAATVTSVGTSHASELAKVFGFTLTATEVATGTV